MKTENKHYAALDILKFICALLVVAIHTAPLIGISDTGNFVLVQIIARLAVPIFFMCSGYFFFKKMNFRTKDLVVKEDNWIYYKRYIAKLIRIYSVWTLIYLVIIIVDWIQGGFNAGSILRLIRDYFVNGSYYHLWYFPALIFAISMLYFAFQHFSKKMIVITSFSLYAIGMLGNVYSGVLEGIPILNKISSIYTPIFVTTRNGLFFAMIFVALGALLTMYNLKFKTTACARLFVISLILMSAEAFILKKFGIMHDLASMYLFLIPTVLFLFIWVKNINIKGRGIYKGLRILSVIVYVLHIFIIRVLNGL
ncbi:MAG: acyltransferase, partial [Erysipelotrichaceae bacterium]